MSADLHEDLTALAARATVPPLDFPTVRRAASSRRRQRRLAVVIPLAAALVALPFLPLGQGEPEERRTTVAEPAPAEGPLQVAVTGLTLTPEGASRLTVQADPEPVPIGHRTWLRLTWTAPVDGPAALTPLLLQDVQVRADEGGGVLGVGDSVCGQWVSNGDRWEHSCPYRGTEPIEPGGVVQSEIFIYPRVASGQVAPGTYRVSLPLRDTVASLDIVLTVTHAAVPSAPEGAVRVTGDVFATYGRGVVVVGEGPAPATVTLTEVGSGAQEQTTTTDGSFQLWVAPGTYRVEAEIIEGWCTAQTVTLPATAALRIACQDGYTTF